MKNKYYVKSVLTLLCAAIAVLPLATQPYPITTMASTEDTAYCSDIQLAGLKLKSELSNTSYFTSNSSTGTWIQSANGKWWYRHSDGTYTTNDWEFINGSWYYFDSNGYRRTGWIKKSGYWYYLNSEGIMQRGWV